MRADFEIWCKLEQNCQIKINGYISSLTDKELNIMEDYKLFYFLDMDNLREGLINVFMQLPYQSQYYIIRSTPHKFFPKKL